MCVTAAWKSNSPRWQQRVNWKQVGKFQIMVMTMHNVSLARAFSLSLSNTVSHNGKYMKTTFCHWSTHNPFSMPKEVLMKKKKKRIYHTYIYIWSNLLWGGMHTCGKFHIDLKLQTRPQHHIFRINACLSYRNIFIRARHTFTHTRSITSHLSPLVSFIIFFFFSCGTRSENYSWFIDEMCLIATF